MELRPLFSLDYIGAEALILFQVLLIDLVLAGDNAIIVGLAVKGLPHEQQRRAIFLGIAAAPVMRIGFARVALQLLAIVGLLFAGGLLLLWVCWRMFRELRRPKAMHQNVRAEPKTMRAAMMQIMVADLSMSLDNVLAVAGAAHEHPYILVAGLAISVVLMGAAATMIARLLDRLPWLAWVGLSIVLYVALKMMWDGGHEIAEAVR